MDTLYKVLFKGEIKPGSDINQVKQKVATLYKVQINKIEALFSGNLITVKENNSSFSGIKL